MKCDGRYTSINVQYLLDQHFKTNLKKRFLKDEMRLKVFEIGKALTKCWQNLTCGRKWAGAGGGPWQIQGKCREQNRNSASFIDLTKAFDTVSQDRVWKILAHLGCPQSSSPSSASSTKARSSTTAHYQTASQSQMASSRDASSLQHCSQSSSV